MGAKVFREQLQSRQFDNNSSSYIIMNSLGSALFKSTNCSSEIVTNVQQSASFKNMTNYLALLNGQIIDIERMKEFIQEHNINEASYNQLVSEIKRIHVSNTPVNLENIPYLEHLCGWKQLDKPILKRLKKCMVTH